MTFKFDKKLIKYQAMCELEKRKNRVLNNYIISLSTKELETIVSDKIEIHEFQEIDKWK